MSDKKNDDLQLETIKKKYLELEKGLRLPGQTPLILILIRFQFCLLMKHLKKCQGSLMTILNLICFIALLSVGVVW